MLGHSSSANQSQLVTVSTNAGNIQLKHSRDPLGPDLEIVNLGELSGSWALVWSRGSAAFVLESAIWVFGEACGHVASEQELDIAMLKGCDALEV